MRTLPCRRLVGVDGHELHVHEGRLARLVEFRARLHRIMPIQHLAARLGIDRLPGLGRRSRGGRRARRRRGQRRAIAAAHPMSSLAHSPRPIQRRPDRAGATSGEECCVSWMVSCRQEIQQLRVGSRLVCGQLQLLQLQIELITPCQEYRTPDRLARPDMPLAPRASARATAGAEIRRIALAGSSRHPSRIAPPAPRTRCRRTASSFRLARLLQSVPAWPRGPCSVGAPGRSADRSTLGPRSCWRSWGRAVDRRTAGSSRA